MIGLRYGIVILLFLNISFWLAFLFVSFTSLIMSIYKILLRSTFLDFSCIFQGTLKRFQETNESFLSFLNRCSIIEWWKIMCVLMIVCYTSQSEDINPILYCIVRKLALVSGIYNTSANPEVVLKRLRNTQCLYLLI